MLVVSDSYGVHLIPSKISKPYGLKLINVIDLRGGNICIIAADCPLNIFCMIMSLEASNNALVHRLDIGSKIWPKIHNVDISKTIWVGPYGQRNYPVKE
jgi:hypothetical protein